MTTHSGRGNIFPMTHPGGRPKITTSDFPNGWQSAIIEQYREGASDVEIYACFLGICHETFTRIIKEDDEFSETIKKGRQLSEAWWVKNGRTNLKDKEFNYTGWYMQMKNRFGWADRQDIANTHTFKQMGTVKVGGVGVSFKLGNPD